MAKKSFFLFFVISLCTLLSLPSGYAHTTKQVETRQQAAEATGKVPLLEGLYALDFPITTKSDLAGQYFNQGLVLAYGFDHIDAEKSFLEALKHDPECAMCYFGVALVLGPNINAQMGEAAARRAHEFAQKALRRAGDVSEREALLIRALTKRYAPEPKKNRASLDMAFSEAMRDVAKKYPDDVDINLLFAEALMDLHPWDYWTAEGKAQPWTPEIREKLESIVIAHPDHPHAHHLYIHLMENSPFPELTVRSADLIINLVPASGHLVHMAGHAYFAAGLYHDCSVANEKAAAVDDMLKNHFPPEGLYHFLYIPHVKQYLWASYVLEGRSRDARKIAMDLAESAKKLMEKDPDLTTLHHYFTVHYFSLTRFGMWEQILAEEAPDQHLRYPRGAWHYMRGLAYARKHMFEEAEGELQKLAAIASDKSLKSVTIWDLNNAADLLTIAAKVLAGELAGERGRFDEAVKLLEEAVTLEEELVFDEPPPWYYPVRQSLGAVLLDAGRPGEAEKVYREDLKRNPENGWSLFGLSKSLRAQGKNMLAEDAEQRFRRAFSRADIQLDSSRF